ncbi:MAG: hypothetical protein IT313_06020 [Anaerolineales bacterium]|nr:hypothetical protein [Anaerolineales bacterium]
MLFQVPLLGCFRKSLLSNGTDLFGTHRATLLFSFANPVAKRSDTIAPMLMDFAGVEE